MVKFLIQNEDKCYTVEDSSLSEVSMRKMRHCAPLTDSTWLVIRNLSLSRNMSAVEEMIDSGRMTVIDIDLSVYSSVESVVIG